MGIRGELFSTKILLQNRTYFFNVKENRLGDLYLNIVESKNRETGGFDRQSVILFAEDLPSFLKGFDESLKVLEKAVREQKRTGGKRPAPEDSGKPGRSREPRKTVSGEPKKQRYSRGKKPDAKATTAKGNFDGGPKRGKRIVVKKSEKQ
ncbi:hypothetical protein FACS189468_0530 [Spirochaetia bacterium]|nr:hypothetical protein FACS189468_0530 [Spirochaetia bacterium]